jgi:hypothetical protein
MEEAIVIRLGSQRSSARAIDDSISAANSAASFGAGREQRHVGTNEGDLGRLHMREIKVLL